MKTCELFLTIQVFTILLMILVVTDNPKSHATVVLNTTLY